MMEHTFTYTARSVEHPERVVTFTLYDHHVSVDLAAPLEQVARALQERARRAAEETNGREAAEAEEVTEGEAQAETKGQPEESIEPAPEFQRYAWIKPATVSLLERATQSFDVNDVRASAEHGGLRVTMWVRTKGLRLAPVVFAWRQVDNPQGAENFAEELNRRREVSDPPGRFRGLMDYWASWLLAGLLAFVLFLPRRRKSKREEVQEPE